MYKAALFASDGKWVTAYARDTISEVWAAVEDRGSAWFFYPIAVVIRDRGNVTTGQQRIVDAPDMFASLRGHTLKTFGDFIVSNPDIVETILTV